MDRSPGLSVKSFYSLRGAIQHIEEQPVPDEVESIEITQVPPDVDELTDEEDLDDEVIEDDCRDPSFLPPEVSGTVELHQYPEGDDVEDSPPKKKTKVSQTERVVWRKKNPTYNIENATNGAEHKREEMKEKLRGKSNVELFEQFFTEELLEMIATQSKLYASQNNVHEYIITPDCLRVFLGILLFTGYHRLPSERQYWSCDEDLDTPIIRNAMPINRYIEIKRYLHFVDNEKASQNKDDKAFKLRPIYDYLNEKFKSFGIFSRELSIDEQIVRYYGKNGLKQFMRGKPIRFGFKQWIMCCGRTGYCYQMDLYQGKEKKETGSMFKDTLGGKVVLAMTQHLDNTSDHEIYLDNFFTSYKLLAHMKDLGIRVTGTTRANRTAKCSLESDIDMKKKSRGVYDYKFDKENGIFFLKWNDNSIVTIGSNHQSFTPVGSAKRWSNKERKHINVPQPHLIAMYNKYMGGVDHLDWLTQKYRIGVRGKKWYFNLFTNLVDTAVVNAWIISTIISGTQTSLLDFKRSIARYYLHKTSPSKPKQPGRVKKMTGKVLPDIRFDGRGHRLERTEGGKQRKCAQCKRKVSKQCVKCNVGLHMGDCENQWHTYSENGA